MVCLFFYFTVNFFDSWWMDWRRVDEICKCSQQLLVSCSSSFLMEVIFISHIKKNLLWILQKVLDNKEELIFEHSGWMPMLTPWVHNNVKVFGYKWWRLVLSKPCLPRTHRNSFNEGHNWRQHQSKVACKNGDEETCKAGSEKRRRLFIFPANF